MAEQHDERKAVKRRGIMAAAAAVLAGIAAKQTAEPVRASESSDAFQATGGGGFTIAFQTNNGTAYDIGVDVAGVTYGVYGSSGGGSGVYGTSTSGTGVSGTSTSGMGVNGHSDSSYGVYATSSATTLGGAPAIFGTNTSGDNGIGVSGVVTTGTGIKGDANGGTGVFGLARTGGLAKAVYGKHLTNGYGVYGEATSGPVAIGVQGVVTNGDATARGVYGTSGSYGYGVYGTNTYGTGVYGATTSGYGVQGVGGAIGVRGDSSGVGGFGVYATSTQGTGIYGQTGASYQYGILGTTYAANSTAIAGTCTQNGSSAFSGGTGNANAYAAYFQGHVQVDGPFDVIGAGNKHAAVAHPDGSHRTIYSMESPEAWVEDFGEGTLAGGKAEIKLDADFAALIHTETYHVFVTPHVEQHLHVSQRIASGFVVEASAALAKAAGLSGAGSGTFSWRVVAKPKTSAKVERLAKVQIADAKALLPDPAKIKAPEAPKAAAPPKP